MSQLRLALPEGKYKHDSELLKDQFIFDLFNKEYKIICLGNCLRQITVSKPCMKQGNLSLNWSKESCLELSLLVLLA